MSATLENTGERMIPEHHKGTNIYGAHIARYEAASDLVSGKTVLDVACGSGYGTKLLAGVAKKVYGVDIDKSTVEYATEHYGAKNISFLHGDAIDIPLEDGSVEVVVSFETIEHLDDSNKFFAEIKRVLVPGGLLILSTPNDDEYIEDNEFHLHEFDYSELKKAAEKNFKYHKEYFQTHWVYSTILPQKMHENEWASNIKVVNTTALKPQQCIFFIFVCSDSEILADIKPVGVVGEHYRLLDLQARNNKMKAKQEKIEELAGHIAKVESRNKFLEVRMSRIENSMIWKLSVVVWRASKLAKRLLRIGGRSR